MQTSRAWSFELGREVYGGGKGEEDDQTAADGEDQTGDDGGGWPGVCSEYAVYSCPPEETVKKVIVHCINIIQNYASHQKQISEIPKNPHNQYIEASYTL